MNFRNVADLDRDIRKWVEALPGDIDLVVGVPRSGLLAGNILALHLNLPLTDVDGVLAGRTLCSGRRLGTALDFGSRLNLLVVDDSVFHGTQLQATKQQLAPLATRHRIAYAAPYVTPEGSRHVEYWVEILGPPRVFEWNLFHHAILGSSCVDLDGVLCRDPTEEEDDDGERYRRFIADVRPLARPTVAIGSIVTCRLERYRQATEAWLRGSGIHYGALFMMDYPNKKARMAAGAHAHFKAQAYARLDASLFIESSLAQARSISALTGRHVYCAATAEMIQPSLVAAVTKLAPRRLQDFCLHPLRATHLLASRTKRSARDACIRLNARLNVSKQVQ